MQEILRIFNFGPRLTFDIRKIQTSGVARCKALNLNSSIKKKS